MESPLNAEVVACRSAARCGAPTSSGTAVVALIDTVTLNRGTAVAVSSESNPAVQSAADDNVLPTNIPCHRRAPSVSIRHRKAHLSGFRRDRPEGVRRQLRRRGGRQRADHLPVQPERRL